MKRHARALEQHAVEQVSGDQAKRLWARPEVKRARRRTIVRREPLFADDAAPRALQPIVAERSFEMGSSSILILGGAGLLGKALSETFIRSGKYTVYSGDQNNSTVQGIHNEQIDVFNEFSLHKALRDKKVVINCTGQITRPIKSCLRLNSIGTANIARAVTHHDIHLIHISSVDVYGTTDTVTRESDALNPETPYSTSKAISEIILSNEIAQDKLSILRLCNLYGEEQTKGLLSYLVRSFNNDQPLKLYETGYKCRYPIHCKDAAEIIYRFLDQGPFSGIYNIKGPDMYSTRDLISMCTRITGKTLKACYEETTSCHEVCQLDDKKLRDKIPVKYLFSLDGYLREHLNFALETNTTI